MGAMEGYTCRHMIYGSNGRLYMEAHGLDECLGMVSWCVFSVKTYCTASLPPDSYDVRTFCYKNSQPTQPHNYSTVSCCCYSNDFQVYYFVSLGWTQPYHINFCFTDLRVSCLLYHRYLRWHLTGILCVSHTMRGSVSSSQLSTLSDLLMLKMIWWK